MDMDKIRIVESSFSSQLFDSDQFLREAQRQGFLTKYQVERLLAGETTGFYYGDYRIQYLIGAGSFARVFRCIHKDSGKVFAVKVLRARYRDDKQAIEEFVREGEMGMQLRHPNIAQVYEAKQTKYDHYMVMEFIEGNTLKEMLTAQKNGYLDPKRATRIVLDVCSALEYAQKRGFQHRDMKPSNIMVSSTGKAVLLDFGLLTDQSSNFKTQRAIEYAALERCTHVRRDDRRSDLYFLGAVYFQSLTGIAPLGEIKDRARRLDASRFKNVKMIHEVSKNIPRCVATIVDKSLRLRPEERYQTPEQFKADLERVVGMLERGETGDLPASTKPKAEKVVPTKTIMIVEANSNLQETFREFFKNAGFRPLVISAPELALSRLEDVNVDAVLFNAQSIGRNAVLAFNKLLESQITKDLPAILLLNEDQVKWGAAAKRSKKRLAVGMPISMKRLLMVVDKLLKEEAEPSDEKTDKKDKEKEQAKDAASQGTTERSVGAQMTASVDAPEPDRRSEAEEAQFSAAYDEALDDAFSTISVRPKSAPKEEPAPRTEDSYKKSDVSDEDDDYYMDDEDYEKD